jgi:hypothetical protein
MNKNETMKRFYWTGISNDERIKAIDEITCIIDKYGIILNSNRFSDISLSLVIEIEELKVIDLYDSLKPIMSIEGMDNNFTDSKIECMVLFSITFLKGTGDLKIKVPNVPG